MNLFKHIIAWIRGLFVKDEPVKILEPITYDMAFEPVIQTPSRRIHGHGGHPRHAAMVPLKPFARVGR